MKSNEKKMIFILIVVAVIIIVGLTKVKNAKSTNEIISSDVPNQNQVTNSVESYAEILDDGSKLNVSDKLSETKTFKNFEISNIQLTAVDGQSRILADVKNVGASKSEMTFIDIVILDRDGNEITTIGGVIGEVEAGATTQLNASATTDFANAYNFEIKAAE